MKAMATIQYKGKKRGERPLNYDYSTANLVCEARRGEGLAGKELGWYDKKLIKKETKNDGISEIQKSTFLHGFF